MSFQKNQNDNSMPIRFKRGMSAIGIVALLVAIAAPIVFVQNAKASNLQQAYVRLDRLKTATPTSGLVCVNPKTSTTTNIDIAVTFPTVAVTDYTLNATGANWAATGSNIPAGT
ncbi:MAG: hypothetical protein WCL23_05495, partial [Candidatus Moraniibacteriota bacterium]